MLIAHISDLHVMPQGSLLYNFVDSNAACARALGHINSLLPPVDLLLVSGDTVNSGSERAYAMLNRLLGDARPPVFLVPGNHDDPSMLRSAAGAYHRAEGPKMDYALNDYPLRILMLDSTLPGAVQGRLESRQLDWIEKELCSSSRPALLCMHHPPLPTGNAHMDQFSLQNGPELLARISGFGHLLAIASGHTHRAIFLRAGGVLCLTAPSTVTGILTDFEDPAGFFRPGEGSFILHSYTGERGLVSFVEPVPQGQAFPFSAVDAFSTAQNSGDDYHV
jgi:3',5'-cyclic AMP phosphodiesterase CpdA